MEVHRGEVFYADLSPVVGSEQGGVRPVLIVQNEIGNRHSPTVIAAAITSRLDKARLPTHINIRAGLEEVAAVGVEDDRQRHFFHRQAADGLAAEVGPCDDLQRLDALGHQRTGTAQRGQIDRAVADDGLFDCRVPLALTDHDLIAEVQQAGAHGVHPSAGGRPGRADDLARALRRRADVVDGATL